MSERSKRRDLEMAVIDAAVRWKCGIANKWRDAAYGDIAQELSDAVVAYCEHGLANVDKPRAGLRAPETSHDAAEWAKLFAVTDAGRVFREIYCTWRQRRAFDMAQFARRNVFPMGIDDDGLTSDEIEETLARTHQSISARVNALKNAGWIIDSGQKRETRSGGKAIVWTPTQAAREFVEEYGMPIPVSP